jgi:hypothetical protein
MNRAKSAYPLAALALLITALAILLACIDFDRWRAINAWLAENSPVRGLAVFGSAGLFGGFIGCVYAIASDCGWRMYVVAILTGIIAGEIGVFILVAPGPIWRTIVAISVLLVSAILFRLGAE